MNECDLDIIVFEHGSWFTMVTTINIKIFYDVGCLYGGFVAALAHITLNFQIPYFSTINKKIGGIVRNETHNFRQQGHNSYYDIN